MRDSISSSKRSTVRFLYLIAPITLVAIIYYIYKPQSPKQIAQRTVHALEIRDSKNLCELSDPQELAQLGITANKVSLILKETIWSPGYARWGQVQQAEGVYPSDQSIWFVRGVRKTNQKLECYITINDDPKKGWHLNLSRLLRAACVFEDTPRGAREGLRLYRDLAIKHDISGLRGQEGNYVTIDRINSEVSMLFRNKAQ